jgi:putative sigma-54 modulation protein
MFQNRHLQLMAGTHFVVQGVHLDVTDALRQFAVNKASRLFRHNQRISRIRIDLELDHNRPAAERFVAKGHLEVGGVNLIANARSENVYKAIDQLVDSLDDLLSSRPQSNPPMPTELSASQVRA